MICENCGKEHDGSYGSGRFCCVSCRVSFTNKNRGKHSKETKQKISESIHNKRTLKHCKVCGNTFYRGEGYKTSKVFCCEECHNNWSNNKHIYIDFNTKVKKINATKHINNTYKKSKLEDECYILLKEYYPDIIRQYSSNVYPFNCDFYIPSFDLYIEYNGFWTHGKHLFNSNSKEDLNLINKWKSKNKKIYDNAIYTWTDLDVRKQEFVHKNKLNHIIFWNLDDVKRFINK